MDDEDYDRDERDDDDDDDDGDDDDSSSDDSKIHISFETLPDAVVKRSDTGRPSRGLKALRSELCDGREDDPVIFYHLKVSRHWAYFWLCSEKRARRASSRVGARKLRKWLKGFKRRSVTLSAGCTAGTNRAIQKGTHESGIKATAQCDGRIVLQFPTGGKPGIKRFTVLGDGSSGGGGGGSGGGYSAPPACPTCNCKECPRCDSPRLCPKPRCPRCPACPQRKKCPKCSCKAQALTAGKTGFKQGVRKACTRICGMLYKRCRKINPATAMCHQLSEYCAEKCMK